MFWLVRCPGHGDLPVSKAAICPRAQPPRRGIFVAVFLMFLFGWSDHVHARDGHFEVRNAETRLLDGVWFANAQIDYLLSQEALEALESGVTLTIQLQFEITRARRFWPDKEVASLQQDYQLSFQPLSERYVVRNVNSGEQASFATLFGALNSLGQVVELPIIDASLLNQESAHRIALRAVLDQNTLPGPLQLLAFWSDGFRLESDWYRWNLKK